jgi:hypothetical protein
MAVETNMTVNATVYLADAPGTESATGYWAEGEAATVEIERTDRNEIRLGIQLHDSDTDDATIYLTDGEAARLMMLLGQGLLS